MRKTKIICTLGPASDSEEMLRKIINAGTNVIRLNFSHQTHKEQIERVKLVKKVRKELNLPIALMADTKGPEIRTGIFDSPVVKLVAGQTFTLTANDVVGNDKIAKISFTGLPDDVNTGTKILIDDGLIEMTVESKTDTDILCRVINGGKLSANKSINVPEVKISLPFISSADRADIRFAVENKFDFIAASFTRTAQDVMQIRDELARLGGQQIRIIAKIENREGVANVDSILAASDGIMVARGDLGVEIPFEEIPVIQKKLIKKAYTAGKQVITATQMLETMIVNPRPTRAEATDIANAIYDGTSAIMLSGETAAGVYPYESVKTMARIAERTEHDIDYKKRFNIRDNEDLCTVTDAISHASCAAAHDLDASAIITVTKAGGTARMISKFRPFVPIICGTMDDVVMRQLSMAWGVTPIHMDEMTDTDELFAHSVNRSKEEGLVKDGDLVVITAGVPLGKSGTTNMLKVHVVGENW